MPLLTRRQALALTLASATLPFTRTAFAAADAAPVKIALDWTPNTNHVGLYVAQAKNFYRDAGLDVQILPYTDTGAGTLVANGVADFGISGPIGLFTQHAAGADIKGVYAVMQTETGRVVFNDARKDIQRPRDLDGKTYGGFGSAWENALISAIIRNDAQMGCLPAISVTPQAAAGSVKILAVSTAKRSPFLPDVPTLKESGIDVDADAWNGIIAPGGTPPAIIAQMNKDIVDIIKQPAAREKLAAQLMEVVGNSPEEFRARIQSELDNWASVIKAADIKVN